MRTSLDIQQFINSLLITEVTEVKNRYILCISGQRRLSETTVSSYKLLGENILFMNCILFALFAYYFHSLFLPSPHPPKHALQTVEIKMRFRYQMRQLGHWTHRGDIMHVKNRKKVILRKEWGQLEVDSLECFSNTYKKKSQCSLNN